MYSVLCNRPKGGGCNPPRSGSQQVPSFNTRRALGNSTRPVNGLDVTRLDSALQGYFHNGLASSTHRSYDCALRRFNSFCVEYSILDSFPVNCIFPGRYAPLTYYEDVLEASRNMFMARNAREICNFFAHLYLHNG